MLDNSVIFMLVICLFWWVAFIISCKTPARTTDNHDQTYCLGGNKLVKQ